MSSNHKAPLAAFVVVAIACVVVLATNSMRSYARDAWRNFAAPVVSGLAFLPSEHQEPAKPAVAAAAHGETIVPAGPSSKTSTPERRAGVRKVRHPSGSAKQPAQPPAATSGTVSTASTAPVTPATSAPKPVWSSAPQHSGFGSHQGWTQGQHEGWGSSHGSAQGQHHGWGSSQGSSQPSTYNNASSHSYGDGRGNGYGGGWKSSGARSYGNGHSTPTSKVTHGPSWKTAGGNANTAQGTKAPVQKSGGSWGSSAHGYGYGGSHHGRGH